MNSSSVLHPHLAFLNSRHMLERQGGRGGRNLSARCGKVGKAPVDGLLCEAHKPLPHSGRASPQFACERLDDVRHDLGMGVSDMYPWCSLVFPIPVVPWSVPRCLQHSLRLPLTHAQMASILAHMIETHHT